MEFGKFIEWAFYGIVGFSSMYAVSVLSSLKNSVSELNGKIGIIIEKTAWHEKWLEKHENELYQMRVSKK